MYACVHALTERMSPALFQRCSRLHWRTCRCGRSSASTWAWRWPCPKQSASPLSWPPDKQQTWQSLLDQHNIQHPAAAAYEKLAPWGFADFCFGMGFDYFQSITKLRRAGFDGMKLDSGDMWLGWLDELQHEKLFPL
jgi:hypothetical protein